MPVYLPPLSRRDFLKGSLAASALVAAGATFVGESIAHGESWALLSDIHIAANPLLVHNHANITRNLQKVASEILHWATPLSGVLINGDLAYNDGEVADYEAVLGLLRPLREKGLPLHLALGNHDYREHFWATLPKDKSISPKLPDRQTAIVRTTHANWFILDSLRHTRETPASSARRNEPGWPRRWMLTPINPPSLPFIIIRLWALPWSPALTLPSF